VVRLPQVLENGRRKRQKWTTNKPGAPTRDVMIDELRGILDTNELRGYKKTKRRYLGIENDPNHFQKEGMVMWLVQVPVKWGIYRKMAYGGHKSKTMYDLWRKEVRRKQKEANKVWEDLIRKEAERRATETEDKDTKGEETEDKEAEGEGTKGKGPAM
jgi:hypothetical protein